MPIKTLTIQNTFMVYEQLSELPEAIYNLMQSAVKARNVAYSPYSKFNVGTAILMSNGKVVIGANQENAAYPSGLCAERVAIYQAGTLYPEETIVSMAITATSKNHKVSNPIPPCGACRQTISEYENKQSTPIELYFMGEEGSIMKSDSLAALLPMGFEKSNL